MTAVVAFTMLIGPAAASGQSQATPQTEFQTRVQAVQAGEAEPLPLADWAADHGLIAEADELYRQVLIAHPGDDDAYQRLSNLWDGRALPRQSDAFDSAHAVLPQFTVHETKHFVVLSDASKQTVIEHAARLEQTLHQFNRYVDRLELRPLPLRYKLVCVLFAERDDYVHFAAVHDSMQSDWVAGYYTPKHDRAVFYDAQHNPSVSLARGDLDAARQQLDDARSEARRALRDGARRQAQNMHKQIDDYRLRLEAQRREIDAYARQLCTATTLHETTHQLLFHTQVQSPYVEYPMWISEGLATAFESGASNATFGPDFEFELRRRDFEQLVRDEQLMPLRELVTTVRPPDADRDAVHVLYHQSYALVTWLNRFHRDELAGYLRAMREHEPGRLTAAEHLAVFEEAFGDVDHLERAWLRDERARLD